MNKETKIMNDYIPAKNPKPQNQILSQSTQNFSRPSNQFQNVLFSALSGEKDDASQCQNIRVVKEQNLRDRLNTLEEMELIGEGQYGIGNQPLISKGQKGNQSDEEEEAKGGNKKILKKLLREQKKKEKKVDHIKQNFANFITFARILEDVEKEFSSVNQAAASDLRQSQMNEAFTRANTSLKSSFYRLTDSINLTHSQSEHQNRGMFQGVFNAAKYYAGYGESHGEVKVLTQREQIARTNQLRIQGALHQLCLFIFGVKRYLNISLPFPLILTKQGGFMIRHNGTGVDYPLYLVKYNHW